MLTLVYLDEEEIADAAREWAERRFPGIAVMAATVYVDDERLPRPVVKLVVETLPVPAGEEA